MPVAAVRVLGVIGNLPGGDRAPFRLAELTSDLYIDELGELGSRDGLLWHINLRIEIRCFPGYELPLQRTP
jgi:hypothetical protein